MHGCPGGEVEPVHYTVNPLAVCYLNYSVVNTTSEIVKGVLSIETISPRSGT